MPDQVIIDLLKNANSGQAEDQFRLAQYYDTGDKTRKIKQDTKKAFKWFTKAADQGDQRAILAVSKCYQEGIGVPSSPLLAAKFLYQIIDRDLEQQKNLCNLVCKLLRRENQEARSFLVSIYSEDWKIPDDLCQLAEYALQISSEKPEYYSRAHYQLGKLYSGHFPGIKHNLSQAVAHYQQAADLDHREALYWLAQGHLGLLKLPLKASLNQPLGEDYLQKIVAINPGDNLAAEAFYQLGILQDKGGSGVGISSPQQLKYYQQAADLNHPQALERLADCYLNGSDVIPQDLQLAADYLGKRALLEPESIEYLKKSSDLFSRNVPDQQPSEPYLHAVLKICPQNPEANFLIWKKKCKDNPEIALRHLITAANNRHKKSLDVLLRLSLKDLLKENHYKDIYRKISPIALKKDAPSEAVLLIALYLIDGKGTQKNKKKGETLLIELSQQGNGRAQNFLLSTKPLAAAVSFFKTNPGFKAVALGVSFVIGMGATQAIIEASASLPTEEDSVPRSSLFSNRVKIPGLLELNYEDWYNWDMKANF